MNQEKKEPILMMHQEGAFNCDNFIAEEFIKLRDKFDIESAIETGTCLAWTTKWLSENFKEVFTVEISEQYRNFALKRLEGKTNVTSALGNSPDFLKEILSLPIITNKTILFLDAHWSTEYCPLKDELKAIAQSGLKPVIAIHDFVVPQHPEFGFDEINGQPFTYEWLKPEFDAIYGEGNYEHHYNTGLQEQSAKRGIIFVTPKLT